MGMAALGMVIVFTFLLFQKIRTADSAPQWLAASKPGKLQEKNHVEKIHHRD